jgi:AcrR family transcriptional regulator
MPKQVDQHERRDRIARALWRVVDRDGILQLSLRDVAAEAGISLGQLQHYFPSRAELLNFAVDLVSEQTAGRVTRQLHELGDAPHPRDVLRALLVEMLPLGPDARTASRVQAAYVLTALHDDDARSRARDGLRHGRTQVAKLVRRAIADGHIAADRDPTVETNLLLALTGFTPLLEMGALRPRDALTAIDQYLDRLFAPSPTHGSGTAPSRHRA